ncbi:hypothetical protein AVEN_27049-1, partial [Araneus ventricosus]
MTSSILPTCSHSTSLKISSRTEQCLDGAFPSVHPKLLINFQGKSPAVSCTDDSQCGEREKCVGEEGEKTCRCADGLGGENCDKQVWCEDTGKFKNCKDEYGKCEYSKE